MATKKIKKVETPIDRRETFVSIQKNFAGSDLSVEEKLKTLYDLQQADSQIDKILQLRGELPAEVEALEQDMASLKEKTKEILAVIDGYNETIGANKQDIIDCDTLISKYQSQLDSIANSREYDSINKEIENQELVRKIAEKNIVDTKGQILAMKEQLEVIKTKTAICSDDLKAKKAELATIVESTAKEEKALADKRKACAAKIDARTMSAYDRIRLNAHNHLAVVTIFNGNSCGGCFNQIIPQRILDINSGKKLVICEHCGRIIVGEGLAKGEPEKPSKTEKSSKKK